MDGSHFPVRAWQLVLGLAYAFLSALAVLRLSSGSAAVLSVGMSILGFVSSREIPDVRVRSADLWRVIGWGPLLLFAGCVAIALGGSSALGWTAIVLSYTAGNRLRASGVLSGRPS